MNFRLRPLTDAIRHGLGATGTGIGRLVGSTGRFLFASRRGLVAAGLLGLAGWAAVTHPPLRTVARGDIGVRTNQFTGSTAEFREGSVFVLPGFHELRTYPLRDQVYRLVQGRKADGDAPFQSVEGLSLGVDLSIRYALDPSRIAAMAGKLPDDIPGEVVQPAVQGVVYKAFTRYTVREIFSSKRAEIQQAVEAELRTKLAVDGILLRSVQMGQVDLPADYRQGMDKLLAEELASEKMRYTLELKEKRVKETELEAQADKVRRETAAAAAANEQVIAARAQEEAMKHVLPFKQKQIEQRQFEAEAEKVSRIKSAEASAQARKIEAAGEAESRQKLADAEAYRLDRVGKIASEQMARDGALITRHPLLIQKTVADKLSDKIQVIIAPPSTDGRFIAAGLIGGGGQAASSSAVADAGTEPVQEGE
ncbi:SPFH domain-containing protein [Eleftheria terrae]|uniref:SPFH domain-containing protein n=1 Tax=Eleftheria terrae TaxID=1597781 RepID=UPI00263BD811|nr:SPFH domain-containing protein [Eleftheria terrae]WKB53117.1 SPFH domain-containing protein [Eleftheria terrae]